MRIDRISKANSMNGKFKDPLFTADGKPRAKVSLKRLQTLWFNTGTLCNIQCKNCYIESSPFNDSLAYLTNKDLHIYLDEIKKLEKTAEEIGFTGGEPFLNPEIISLLSDSLAANYRVLVLTNSMKPMLNHKMQLLDLKNTHGSSLRFRVSIDHYSQCLHDLERGENSWERMLKGLVWLSSNGFALTIAGRTAWNESEEQLRVGYQNLFNRYNIDINAADASELILFPEMDLGIDVPEITTDCWNLLGIEQGSMMCAESRMVVKRKNSKHPTVVACTLIPHEEAFDLGEDLEFALNRSIYLNHPHCAKFCVLGGGQCSI